MAANLHVKSELISEECDDIFDIETKEADLTPSSAADPPDWPYDGVNKTAENAQYLLTSRMFIDTENVARSEPFSYHMHRL